MPLKEKINRQAVVVIHGIGEQRPMDTIRGFVSAVKAELETFSENKEEEKRSTVRSKPDSIGDIYETVRLSMDSTSKRPITDFYEFYWAHNMRDTKFPEIVSWLWHLLRTKPSRIPPRLIKQYYTVWALLLIIGLLAFISILRSPLPPSGKLGVMGVLAALLVRGFRYVLKFFALNYAGDAARYFTPAPDNIGERSKIRQQGISFLKKLHEIKTVEKVDRIIIVAHSLGAVVAYDLLRLLWTQYNTGIDLAKVQSQDKLRAVNQFATKLDQQQPIDLNSFQQAQFEAWDEQKANGNTWLVSDFITVGAAIQAADFFMVSNASFETLQRQREMPICPPVADAKDGGFIFPCFPKQLIPGSTDTFIQLLNHGALYGIIRWTNIFFNCDFVGGEMQRKFGKGVRDICLPRKSIFLFPGGHTDYWNPDRTKSAIKEIVAALKLDSKGI